MALKSVVVDPIFEKTVEILKQLQNRRGELAFAILEQNYAGDDGWHLTIAAPWIDQSGSMPGVMKEVNQLMQGGLGDLSGSFGGTYARATHDPLIRALTPEINIPSLGTPYSISSPLLMAFDLDEVVGLLARNVDI